MLVLRRYAREICVAGALVASALLAIWLTPTIKIADSRPKIELKTLFPVQFAGWREDVSIPIILPPPDVQANLDKIYNQVLTRTYVDEEGYRVMLSVAYGGDQSDGLTVHRPELCYPAQGFEVTAAGPDYLQAARPPIQMTRLLTKLGSRKEPVTYWIVNGDQAVGDRFDARLSQLRYGFKGLIPDGMLIRISSIDGDSERAFRLQRRFAADLIEKTSGALRSRLGAG